MNDTKKELTSALLDGELDPDTQQRAISAMLDAGEQELERFGRYRLIGDTIRGESSVLATSVATRVRRSLMDEPVVLAPPRRQPRQWLRPVAGLAVAASVATAAVFVAPKLMTQPGVDAESVQLAADTQTLTVSPVMVSAGAEKPKLPASREPTEKSWQALTPRLEDRLNRLVVEHHEFGGRTGINGPVPHIGLVSYGTP
ncbi:MAG: sigma-E factor negative regulatory protein [Gammaproteobacteria bacterium]|nr:sigma-E factor negative regulatory protein [Gammaproteobacteria bacterium]